MKPPADKSIPPGPYVRTREAPVFLGLRKGNDALTSARARSPTPNSESGSRSGSSSGSPPANSPRFSSDLANRVPIPRGGKLVAVRSSTEEASAAAAAEDIVFDIKTVRRSSSRKLSSGSKETASLLPRSRSYIDSSTRSDPGIQPKLPSKENASSRLSRSASYNPSVDSSGTDDSGSESKRRPSKETASAAGIPRPRSSKLSADASSTDDSGNESKRRSKETTSPGLPRSRSHSVSSELRGSRNDSGSESSSSGVRRSRSYNSPGCSSGTNDSQNESKPSAVEASRDNPGRSFHLSESKPIPSKLPLPLSAASFYKGFSPQLCQVVESCESIKRVNQYLKFRKDDVRGGVPGKFLQAVIGQDMPGIGSIASTILYAFYLHETLGNDQLFTVPVINMKRADLASHPEISWLLDSCQLDESSLIFVDEIDLHYYDLFGSLKVVLIGGHKLATKQEALKGAVVEVFHCRKAESLYPGVQLVTGSENDSCCTVIAEKFVLWSPETLAGLGFSRLLLAGILLDTGNLSKAQCSSKDKYMATLLISGAGHYGFNGLYQILRQQKHDVSHNLKAFEVLQKDFKKWARAAKSDSSSSKSIASNFGMSSTGMTIKQLLTREDFSIEAIKHFLEFEKLRLLLVVSGYYDSQKNFKREILIVAESADATKSLLKFFDANASELPLKPLHSLGLKDEMRALEIEKIISRKTIEHLLDEFLGPSYSRCQ
ncbi:unnamed protein product [Linum trigynum]|uniref:DHHA2 domain-containing protein n=1 Tax=Linum trigynum TaxID=586398 RepID=A0AAV2FXD6_9ROSI